MKVFAVVFLAFLAVVAAKVSYNGYQVYRVDADKESARFLQEIVLKYNLDVWAESKTSIDLFVSPQLQRRVRAELGARRLNYNTLIKDVGVLVFEEEQRLKQKESRVFTLTDYNTFADIEQYLSDVAATSPYATLGSIGMSVEGRNLWQLLISVGAGKPAVWIDCGIHAREWISPATCLYGIDYLTSSYGTDPSVTGLLDAYDVYIMPVNNPDGYSYTWSDDRMWRKNRNKYPADTCFGVDLNRNFNDHFGGLGTSPNSCAETYHGPSAASEPETQATQNAMLNLIASANLQILFSIHSYSQLWMYPYGWTDTQVPPEAAEMDRVSAIGVNALTAVHGTTYLYGPVATTIYPAAGTTIDYSYSIGITNSYTLELRDTGTFGFLLPAAQITPSGEETWAGLIAAIMAI